MVYTTRLTNYRSVRRGTSRIRGVLPEHRIAQAMVLRTGSGPRGYGVAVAGILVAPELTGLRTEEALALIHQASTLPAPPAKPEGP